MKWYAVYRGRCPGVYDSWSECNEQVIYYEGSSHDSFNSREKAEYHYNQYVLKQKRKSELVGSVDGLTGCASQKRLIGFSGWKNLIILLQFVIIVMLLLSCGRM